MFNQTEIRALSCIGGSPRSFRWPMLLKGYLSDLIWFDRLCKACGSYGTKESIQKRPLLYLSVWTYTTYLKLTKWMRGVILLVRVTKLFMRENEVGGEMIRRYWNINLEEMMEAGVYFGHRTRKWNPRMAPYISAKCKAIHIINWMIPQLCICL